jgi:hypothetical protein
MKRENSYTSPFRCKNISSIKSYSAIIRKNIYFFLGYRVLQIFQDAYRLNYKT